MTLTVTIKLTTEQEMAIRESVATGDKMRLQNLLADAVTPTVQALMTQNQPEEPTDWQTYTTQLSDLFASLLPSDAPVLSDYDMSREGMYEEYIE